MQFSRLLVLCTLLIWSLVACGGSGDDSSGNGGGANVTVTPLTQVATLTSIEKTATAIIGLATAQSGQFATLCTTGIISAVDETAIARLQAGMSDVGVDAISVNVIVTRDQQDCERSVVVNTLASVKIVTADLADNAAIGDVMADALRGFVATGLPQPATISLQFEAGTRQRSFNINFSDAQTYLDDNLTGAALIAAVEGE